MLELRMMRPQDDGLKLIRRVPNAQLKSVLSQFQGLVSQNKENEVELFEVSGSATTAYYTQRGKRIPMDG